MSDLSVERRIRLRPGPRAAVASEPDGEHARLHAWHRMRSEAPIEFDPHIRIRVVETFVSKACALGHQIIACSCGAEHLHALIELPAPYPDAKREIGKCKQKVSHALRDVLRGSIWSEGGELKPIRDVGHLHNTYAYVREKQERGTVVWSHAPAEDWVKDPKLGAIVMRAGERIRVFARAQTPTSERNEDPDRKSTG